MAGRCRPAPSSRMPVDRAGRLRVLSIEVSEKFDPLLARADADCRIYYLQGQPGAHDCAIGYFAKISSTRLNAFSTAACGVRPPLMTSAQAVGHTCVFSTLA